MHLFADPEFWVLVAAVIFVAVVWKPVRKSLIGSLDERAARIRAELDEATKLREEAEQLLAQYQQKQREAETEAASIVAQAKMEAEEIAAEAKTRMEEFVARRTKVAETKIAQAERQAVTDVRAAAADAAVKASETILGETVKGKTADDLLASAIRDVKARLD